MEGKYKFMLPSNETFDMMVSVLMAQKNGCIPNVKATEKYYIQKNFALETKLGADVMIWKNSGKEILKASKMEGVIMHLHQKHHHAGRDSTLKWIKLKYHYVPKAGVMDVIKRCGVCYSLKHPKHQISEVLPLWKPVKATNTMEQVYGNFIDMQPIPDGNQCWIYQMTDQFSRFIWAIALPNKECSVLLDFIRSVFYSFGSPARFQSDSCGEIVWSVIHMLASEFPQTSLSPANLQLDEGEEHEEHSLEYHLGFWIQENGPYGWSRALSKLAYKVNLLCRVSSNGTPFEIMFSRTPHSQNDAPVAASETEACKLSLAASETETCKPLATEESDEDVVVIKTEPGITGNWKTNGV